WKEELELSPVRQEEFEPEQNRDEVAGWIAARELGKQREGSPQGGRWRSRQPCVDPAQVARLSGPRGLDPSNLLPGGALMVDVEGDNRNRSAGIQPAQVPRAPRAQWRRTQIERDLQPRNRQGHTAD